MNPFTLFAAKLSILFSRNRFHSELDEEMAFHRAQVENDLLASGMSPQAARVVSARQFGNTTQLREQSHSLVAFRWESIVQDLRFAARQLRHNLGFALTAIFILALGMGVSVAIFGFVDAALLQPLAVLRSQSPGGRSARTPQLPRAPISRVRITKTGSVSITPSAHSMSTQGMVICCARHQDQSPFPPRA